MKYPALVCLIVAILCGPSGMAGARGMNEVNRMPRKEDDKALITRLEHEWIEAIKSHNYDWFERNFADDCTEINSGDGSIKRKTQDIADFKTDKTIFDNIEFEDLSIRVEGNAAVANGTTHIVAHDEQGQKSDLRLRFTDTWIKRNGRWQVWAAQHTRVRS